MKHCAKVADCQGQLVASRVEAWIETVHAGCAPDHLRYQGRQFSKRQFEKLQGELERPIGEYNCRHIAFPIILGVSRPAHTEQELGRLEEMSTRKLEFDGREYTQYEATQLQRKLETAMRQAKDRALLAKESGDDLGQRIEQTKLNQLKRQVCGCMPEIWITVQV